jgi:hypothetical protein
MAKRRKFSTTERVAIARRARGLCEYCQMPEGYSPDFFEIEPITPLVQDGTNELENLAFSCGGCNQFKGVKMEAVDPLTQQTVRLFHPRQDTWAIHFRWTQDAAIIEGVTAIGRATVNALQLNRIGCVNLRFALVAFGTHPPNPQSF